VTDEHEYVPFISVKLCCVLIHELSPMVNMRNTTGATNGTGTSPPSREPAFIPVFTAVRVVLSLV